MNPTSQHAAAKAPVTDEPAGPPLDEAALAQYLYEGAVTEVLISETEARTYRVEVSLSWKTGRSTLMAARGHPRIFKSLDTVAQLLRSLGIGATVVRVRLKQ